MEDNWRKICECHNFTEKNQPSIDSEVQKCNALSVLPPTHVLNLEYVDLDLF